MGLFGLGKPKEMETCSQCGVENPKSKVYFIKDGILCKKCMERLKDKRRNLLSTHGYSDITMMIVEDALGKPKAPKAKPTECPICSKSVEESELSEIKNGWICKDCFKEAKKKYGSDVSKMTIAQVKASSMNKAFKSKDVVSKVCPVCGKEAISNKQVKDGSVCIECVNRLRGKYHRASETVYVNGSTNGSAHMEEIRDYKNNGVPDSLKNDRFDITNDPLNDMVVADFKEQYDKDMVIEKNVLLEYGSDYSYESLFYVEEVSTVQVGSSILDAGPILSSKINGKTLLSVLRIKGSIEGNTQVDVINEKNVTKGEAIVAAQCTGDSFEKEMSALLGKGSIKDCPRGWLVVESGEYSVGTIIAK